ncbi:MAG: MBL fold metallo-hydrolase [Prevotellaceae bacterium]|nr:MBL fold metallo-hydrolase [Candidatus Minthosoma caballi]
MRITILGTGTSCGVPQIGCPCEVCTSTDPHDRRLRCSALVEVNGRRILIDCGPDFREQMLSIDFKPLDAVLLTHEHYDHVGGLDDLRPYSVFGDVDVYAEKFCADHLIERIPYCFTPKEKRYPGVPAINLIEIEPHKPIIIDENDSEPMKSEYLDDFVRERRDLILSEKNEEKNCGKVAPVEVLPIRVMHGKLPIVGFRIDNFAYITDMKTIPDEEFDYLQGVEYLIVNGLRHKEHPSHQTIEDAIAFSRKIGVKETWLIHMSHHILPHAKEDALFPEYIHLAYDGQVIEI